MSHRVVLAIAIRSCLLVLFIIAITICIEYRAWAALITSCVCGAIQAFYLCLFIWRYKK